MTARRDALDDGPGSAHAVRRRASHDVPPPLPRSFFEQPVLDLAAALLGQLLVRRGPGGALRVGRIVETEAYGGRDVDDTAHSFRGPTPRCEVMFGEAGRAYVYATQGACCCVNVTAEGGGNGRAVLLRAVEPVLGVPLMLRRRLARLADGPTRARLEAGKDHELAAGPGRLCLCLDVDRALNAADVTDPRSPLQLCAGDRPPARVLWTPRIGLDPRAFAHGWHWRAFDADSRAVSSHRGRAGRVRERPWPEQAGAATTSARERRAASDAARCGPADGARQGTAIASGTEGEAPWRAVTR